MCERLYCFRQRLRQGGQQEQSRFVIYTPERRDGQEYHGGLQHYELFIRALPLLSSLLLLYFDQLRKSTCGNGSSVAGLEKPPRDARLIGCCSGAELCGCPGRGAPCASAAVMAAAPQPQPGGWSTRRHEQPASPPLPAQKGRGPDEGEWPGGRERFFFCGKKGNEKKSLSLHFFCGSTFQAALLASIQMPSLINQRGF